MYICAPARAHLQRKWYCGMWSGYDCDSAGSNIKAIADRICCVALRGQLDTCIHIQLGECLSCCAALCALLFLYERLRVQLSLLLCFFFLLLFCQFAMVFIVRLLLLSVFPIVFSFVYITFAASTTIHCCTVPADLSPQLNEFVDL